MNTKILLAVTLLAACSGCRLGVFGKRQQEICCPTDIRKQQSWIWGDDAIFDYPCCTDEMYHGHKPTCWREWDAPASVWRDDFCGPMNHCVTSQPDITYAESPERLLPPGQLTPQPEPSDTDEAEPKDDPLPPPEEGAEQSDDAQQEAEPNAEAAPDGAATADADETAEPAPPSDPMVETEGQGSQQ